MPKVPLLRGYVRQRQLYTTRSLVAFLVEGCSRASRYVPSTHPMGVLFTVSNPDTAIAQQEGTMLPLELCELIIDAVAYDVTGWDFAKVRETLKSCCLVCKSWVPQCRAHLWRTITVHGDRELTKFFQLLSTHPEYGTQVKELSLFISARRSLVFPLLLARKLPHVGCITVHCSMNDAPYVSFPHPSRQFSSFSELAPVTTWSLSGFIFPSVTTFIRVCAAFPQLECVSCFGTTWHKNSGGELSLFRAVNVTSLRVSNTRFPGLSGLWAILTSLPALKSFVCEFVTWDDVNMDTTMAAAPPLSDRLSELCDLSVRDVDFTVQFVDMLLAVFDLRPLITLRAFPHEMCQMEQVARLCHASGSSLRHLFIGDMSKPSLIVSNYPGMYPSHYYHSFNSFSCSMIRPLSLPLEQYLARHPPVRGIFL